ncbi:MAG: hypothetical protein IKW20_08225 [Bacteroidales bacterium]|nr:hypothetical protein [Bacteroidales bacterium]
MIVSVNMSREVYEYFKGHNLSKVADALLEMYDFTNLPQKTGPREKECRLNVSNEYYISLYNTLGPRSKKISLGRLFEFAYTMDVLSLPRFESMRDDSQNDDPTPTLIDRAYKALLLAQKYDKSPELKQLTDLVYEYREAIK